MSEDLDNAAGRDQQRCDTTREVTLAYVRTMSSRMDRVEIDFIDHMRKLETRMDELVELVRDVAALKQQYVTQGEALSELRGAVREQSQRVESSIARVHLRLDEITASVTASIDSETTKIRSRISDQEKAHTDLNQRFQMWLNRGLGSWAAFVVVIGVIQYIGIHWLNTMETERTQLIEKVQKLTTRVTDLENRTLQYEVPGNGRLSR